ncbi:rasGEF domain-containing protein [Ditylenchus destructor]|nr:rasGEF domain-containing protein [Ditylenchus destructor]
MPHRRKLFGPTNTYDQQKNTNEEFGLGDNDKLSGSLAERGCPAASTPIKDQENIRPQFSIDVSQIGSPAHSIISTNNNIQSLKPTHRAFSVQDIVRRPTSAATSNNTAARTFRSIFGVSRNSSSLYFGFVALGDSLTMQHKLTNHSGEQLRLKYSLNSDNNSFQIVNNPPLIIQPNTDFAISLQYTPFTGGQDMNLLIIERINGDYMKFSIKLLGYGGVSLVKLAPKLFESGIAEDTPGGYTILMPDFFPPPPSNTIKCSFDLVNNGNRSAFVVIQAVNGSEEPLTSSHISIKPNTFVMTGKHAGVNNVQKVTIKIYDNALNENVRRESAIPSTIPLVDKCGFRLRIMWGEEAQRIRLKRWLARRESAFLIHGKNFGEMFEHELGKQLESDLMDLPLDCEGDVFRNCLRVIKINVIDRRASKLFPSEAQDLISESDISLLEDFEIRQLHDFVRGKGHGTASRVANFNFHENEESDDIQFGQPENKKKSNGDGNKMSIPLEPGAMQPFSIIMPGPDGRPANILPIHKMDSKASKSPLLAADSERPVVMMPSSDNPEIVVPIGNVPPVAASFGVKQRKEESRWASTTTSISPTQAQNDKLSSDEENNTEETPEPSSEDYEKLAKILQGFVNRRKPLVDEADVDHEDDDVEEKNVNDVITKTTTPSTRGLFSIRPSSYGKSASNTNIGKEHDKKISHSTWNGTVERIKGVTLPNTVQFSIGTQGTTSSPTTTANTPIASITRPVISSTIPTGDNKTSQHSLLGRVLIQPSKNQMPVLIDTTQNSPKQVINTTKDGVWAERMISLTPTVKDPKNRDTQPEDLEWKIREISHELSTVLHKLKKEKELPKSSYSVVLPKSFGGESEDPTKRDQSKAYVSVLREGIARQTDSNQYIFVGSITLIRDDGKVILVDTGLATDINGRTDLIKKLSKLGIVPPRVDYVVTTHGHADHAGNTNEFPDAVHFQGNLLHLRTRFNFSDLFDNDSHRLTANAWLVKTPGHTAEDISVIVRNTDKYGTMVISGDVFIAAEDIDYPMMWKPLAWNEQIQEESRRRLICFADWIVPGHSKVFRVTSAMRARMSPNSAAYHSDAFVLISSICMGVLNHSNEAKQKRDKETEEKRDGHHESKGVLRSLSSKEFNQTYPKEAKLLTALQNSPNSLSNLKAELNAGPDFELFMETWFSGEEPYPVALLQLMTSISPVSTASKKSASSQLSYKEVCTNFRDHEMHYLRDLSMIVNVFKRRLDYGLGADDNGKKILNSIFGNVHEILELTIKIHRTIEDGIDMSDPPCLGTGLYDLVQGREFDSYIRLMEIFREPLNGKINRILKDSTYAEFFNMEDQYCSGTCGGRTFRMAVKYVLPSLLRSIVTHFWSYFEHVTHLTTAAKSDTDKKYLNEVNTCLNLVANSIKDVNQPHNPQIEKLDLRVRRENLKSLQQNNIQTIQRSIEGWVGQGIGHVCNEFIREGSLYQLRNSLTIAENILRGRTLVERRVFLFDQLLVICKIVKNKNVSYKFKEKLDIKKSDIVDLDDEDDLKNAFKICPDSKVTDQTQASSITLCCDTNEEKEDWMTSLIEMQTDGLLRRMLESFLKEEEKRIPLIIPTVAEYRYAEPDTGENIAFEDYVYDDGIPVIRSGTILKLVERLTFPQYTDNEYIKTFMTTYRSFCTTSDLLSLLIERFNIPIPHAFSHLGQQFVPLQQRSGAILSGRLETVQSPGLQHLNQLSQTNFVQAFHRFRHEYQKPIQLKVLRVLHHWVYHHFHDFDSNPTLLQQLIDFLHGNDRTVKLTTNHKKWCTNTLELIKKKQHQTQDAHEDENDKGERDSISGISFDTDNKPGITFSSPDYPEILWHYAKEGDIGSYDLLTLHPLEIGRQMTLLHFCLYRAIKPIELVDAAWTKQDKYQRSPQLLKLIEHSTNLTFWVAKSIVETDSLEERVEMFSRVLEIMTVLEDLNNFTGVVAFYSALNCSSIYRLKESKARLDKEKQSWYDRYVELCNPHWKAMLRRLRSIDPPCVPFAGTYLSQIFFFETGKNIFVQPIHYLNNTEKDLDNGASAKKLVSFRKCRKIANVIRDLQMYQNQPYNFKVEPTIRKFLESLNPLNGFNDKDDLETYLYSQSHKIEPKDGEIVHLNPKHPPEALRSPGVKPPKTPTSAPCHRSRSRNSYSRHTSSSAMSSPRSPNGALAINGRQVSSSQVTSPILMNISKNHNVFFSSSPNEGESNFSSVDINSGQKVLSPCDVGRVNKTFTSELEPISPILSPLANRFTFPTSPAQFMNHRRKPPVPPRSSVSASPTSPTISFRTPVGPRGKPPAPPPTTMLGKKPLPLLAPNSIDNAPPPLAPKPGAKPKVPASPSKGGKSSAMSAHPVKPRESLEHPRHSLLNYGPKNVLQHPFRASLRIYHRLFRQLSGPVEDVQHSRILERSLSNVKIFSNTFQR